MNKTKDILVEYANNNIMLNDKSIFNNNNLALILEDNVSDSSLYKLLINHIYSLIEEGSCIYIEDEDLIIYKYIEGFLVEHEYKVKIINCNDNINRNQINSYKLRSSEIIIINYSSDDESSIRNLELVRAFIINKLDSKNNKRVQRLKNYIHLIINMNIYSTSIKKLSVIKNIGITPIFTNDDSQKATLDIEYLWLEVIAACDNKVSFSENKANIYIRGLDNIIII